jgi:hypothetical protein
MAIGAQKVALSHFCKPSLLGLHVVTNIDFLGRWVAVMPLKDAIVRLTAFNTHKLLEHAPIPCLHFAVSVPAVLKPLLAILPILLAAIGVTLLFVG